MGTISKPFTFSPNTTISSSQVNSNMDTLYNEFNGSISAVNLATDAVTTAKIADSNVTTAKITDSAVTTAKINDGAVTNAKLATGAGEPGGAWTSWTPTWTALTVGNGTVVASYKQIGKVVHYRLRVTLGSTSSVSSNPRFTIPVTSTAFGVTVEPTGLAVYRLGSTYFTGTVGYANTTEHNIYVNVVNATYGSLVGVTSTTPATFANGDVIMLYGTYEAA